MWIYIYIYIYIFEAIVFQSGLKYLLTQVEIFHIIANLQIIAKTRYTEMKFQSGMKISI